MIQASFRLAEQQGKIGYFGEIAIEVDTLEVFGLSIEWIIEANAEWVAGSTFGLHYAWEQASKGDLGFKGVRVRVVEFKGQPIDTRSTVAAYIAALAFWRALNVVPKHPLLFQKETGSFIFPK